MDHLNDNWTTRSLQLAIGPWRSDSPGPKLKQTSIIFHQHLKLMSDQLGIKICPATRQKVTAGQQLNKTKCAICTSGCTHLPILTVHHQCGAHQQSAEPRVIDSRTLSESPGLPSGKRLHNYGKSPPLMGKSTEKNIFNSFLYVYQAGYMKSKRLSPLFGNGSKMRRGCIMALRCHRELGPD